MTHVVSNCCWTQQQKRLKDTKLNSNDNRESVGCKPLNRRKGKSAFKSKRKGINLMMTEEEKPSGEVMPALFEVSIQLKCLAFRKKHGI